MKFGALPAVAGWYGLPHGSIASNLRLPCARPSNQRSTRNDAPVLLSSRCAKVPMTGVDSGLVHHHRDCPNAGDWWLAVMRRELVRAPKKYGVLAEQGCLWCPPAPQGGTATGRR